MKTAALFLTLLFLGLGCSKKDDNPVEVLDDPTTQILPLRAGNSWTYNLMMYDTAGTGTFSGLVSASVLRDSTVGAEHWYVVTNTLSGGPGILKNKSDGLWYSSKAGNFLGLKYPAAAASAFLIQSTTVTVGVDTVSVTVPKGTFVCIKYSVTSGTNVFGPGPTDYYFAKGKGLIQINIYFPSTGGAPKRFASLDLSNYLVQ